MKLSKILQTFLCAAILAQSNAAFAFETDQYNLPPQPLADIGDEVTIYVESNIQKAIDKLNEQISMHQSCLNEKKPVNLQCDSREKEQNKLQSLRSEQTVAREVYNLLGTGSPPFTSSETWLESYQFKNSPARYKTNFRRSIFFTFPTDFIGLGSTVNLYGTKFGTDKIAHLFQQGYTYYKIYNRALTEGVSSDKAAQKAVKWGQKTERTIYGTLISGVYSNADLYANYAGLKFYSGLTQNIKIGETERPAILILKDGLWAFNSENNLPERLIKPFVSNHLNEALNPSVFTNFFGLRGYVRKTVKNQSCAEWFKQFPELSRTVLEKTSRELQLWHGEDYGFTVSKNFITIANTCFENADSYLSDDEKSTLIQDSSTPNNSP